MEKLPHNDEGLLVFSCPRCKDDVTAKVYGPCQACCLELRIDAREHDFKPIPIIRHDP